MHRHELIQRRRQLRQDMAGLGATGTLPQLPAPTERDLLIAALYFAARPKSETCCVLTMSGSAELGAYAQHAPCGGVQVLGTDQGPIVQVDQGPITQVSIKLRVLDEVLAHLVAFSDSAVLPLVGDVTYPRGLYFRPLNDDELAQVRTLVED